MADTKPKVRTLQLPVELDEKARMVRAMEMANVSKDRTDKARELEGYVEASKGTKKTLESELAALDSHLHVLGTVVRTGSEYREVEVIDEIDAKAGVMNTIRLDTGALVGTRGRTEAERQRSLFEQKRTEEAAETAKAAPAPAEAKA